MSTVIGNLDRVRSETAWSEPVQQLKSWMWKSVVVGTMALSEMPFLEHLEELRRRLISGLIAIAICSGLCLVYATELIKFLKQPAEAAGLALASYDSLEMFSIYFTVPLGAGICLAAPVILWQVWKFIEPALYVHEKRYARPFIVLTTICFLLGAAGY